MAISKIRKYLDDLKIQADAAKRRDIDSSGVPKRRGLTAKRHGLSEQFEVAPNNIRLGQEIKGLDDQIAECTEHMRLGH